MIDRLILSALLGTVGFQWTLFPDPPPPLTLKQKAKERSISAMCDRKSKSKEVKDLCKRWKEQQNAGKKRV
jgi:hypothetical protein